MGKGECKIKMATPGQIERARDRQLRSWHGEHVSGTARVAAESRASLSKAEREQRDIFAKHERDIRGIRTNLRPDRGGARVYSPRTARRRGATRYVPVRVRVKQVEKSLRVGKAKDFATLEKARSGWDKTVSEARVSISKIKPIPYKEYKRKYYGAAKQYMAQERRQAGKALGDQWLNKIDNIVQISAKNKEIAAYNKWSKEYSEKYGDRFVRRNEGWVRRF